MGSLQKYGFRIKTRNGLILDSLSVQARDRSEAERRITQIYHYCEILECQENGPAAHAPAVGVDGAIALIRKTRKLPETRSSTHAAVAAGADYNGARQPTKPFAPRSASNAS